MRLAKDKRDKIKRFANFAEPAIKESLENVKEADFVVSKVSKVESRVDFRACCEVFLKGVFRLFVEATDFPVFINGVKISEKFYAVGIDICSAEHFPLVSLKIGEKNSTFSPKSQNEFVASIKIISDPYFERIYYSLSEQNQNEFVLAESSNVLHSLGTYSKLSSLLVAESAKFAKQQSLDIFVVGEKNCGKSTFANFLLNYFLNQENFASVNFCDLDLGKPTFNLQTYVSSFAFNAPIFCNATNSVVLSSEAFESKDFFVGENSPNYTSVSYIAKTEELMKHVRKNFRPISGLQVNVINYHGFYKGFGKFLLADVQNCLAANFIKVKLKSGGKISCSVVDGLKSVKIFNDQLNFKNYFIKQPQFHQDKRQRLAFGYLTETKNICELELKKLKVSIQAPQETKEFYKSSDLDTLAMILPNSVVNVQLTSASGGKTNRLAIVLSVNCEKETIKINVPFLSAQVFSEAVFFELSRTTFYDYNVHKYFQKPLDKGEGPFPFMGLKMVGVGSKTLRRKIAKAK